MKVSSPVVTRNGLVCTVNFTRMNPYVLRAFFKGSQFSHCGSFRRVVIESEVSRVSLRVFGYIYRVR